MKLLTVIGARPQFIKAIALSRAVSARDGVRELIVHTGQHYDDNMSEVFFRELGIPDPAYRLNIGGGGHGEMTGRQLMALEPILEQERPDFCVVYGDTNSTLAAALAAAKIHVPVAHIEAGLRSFNRRMPEEINRILTDHVSEVLFAPTPTAVDNLVNEGFARSQIQRTGDVMYDVARLFIDDGSRHTQIRSELGLSGRYCVATLHRQETTDDPDRLLAILTALSAFSDTMSIVLPLHPRTRKVLGAHPGAAAMLERIADCDPLGFMDMATLVAGASLVVTDSGGLQKEAFFHRVPCVTVRDQTEWVETIEAGWNRLPKDFSVAGVSAAIQDALANPAGREVDVFGDGHAAEQILNVLLGSNN